MRNSAQNYKPETIARMQKLIDDAQELEAFEGYGYILFSQAWVVVEQKSWSETAICKNFDFTTAPVWLHWEDYIGEAICHPMRNGQDLARYFATSWDEANSLDSYYLHSVLRALERGAACERFDQKHLV